MSHRAHSVHGNIPHPSGMPIFQSSGLIPLRNSLIIPGSTVPGLMVPTTKADESAPGGSVQQSFAFLPSAHPSHLNKKSEDTADHLTAPSNILAKLLLTKNPVLMEAGIINAEGVDPGSEIDTTTMEEKSQDISKNSNVPRIEINPKETESSFNSLEKIARDSSDVKPAIKSDTLKKDLDSDVNKFKDDKKNWFCGKIEADEDEEGSEDWVMMDSNPFNMRLVNLNNFPLAQTVFRTNYRSHSVACVRAKLGSIQNTAKSLDLMRQILQKAINNDINSIIQKYLEIYFQPALENIRMNNGDQAVSEEHLQTVCRQILEEAKKMYCGDTRSITPDVSDNLSECGSVDEPRGHRFSRMLINRKRTFSSGSESSSQARKTKKRGRIPAHLKDHSGRSTPSNKGKAEPVKREGPHWDSERLKSDTLFVMGSKANKALGLGATRGRLYIKHPDIFKYSGDQDDKQWLYEKHHMPATGGRTYLLIVDDIKELADTDEYRNNAGLMLNELSGFTVPDWMLEKMRSQMQSQRTDRSKFRTASDISSLAFLPKPSPAPSENQEVLTEQDEQDDEYDEEPVGDSPLNATGGFEHEEVGEPGSEFPNTEESDDESHETPLTGTFFLG